MRGSGKTTLWKLLASQLQFDFFDLDRSIEEYVWGKLSDFIDTNGWETFRSMEHKVLVEILNQNQNKVISLWWGTIVFENNSSLLLKKATKLIYIDAQLDTISKRIESDESAWNTRNSLTGKGLLEELETVYTTRKPIYESFYDLKVENNTSIQECMWEILKKILYGDVCVPIVDFEKHELAKQIEIINTSREIKWVELRIDFLKNEEIQDSLDLLKTLKKQIIITNRSSLEGWKFEWGSEKSIEKLLQCIDLWDGFDLELRAWDQIEDLKKVLKKHHKKLILSYHNFEKTPSYEECKSVLSEMKKYNPEVYKIAVMPQTPEDVNRIYELAEYFKNHFSWDFIFISMGTLGMETRVNIPQMWGLLSFWVLNTASAPWQMAYKELYQKIKE